MKTVKWAMTTSSSSPVGWEQRNGIYAEPGQLVTHFWLRITSHLMGALRDE